MEKTIEIIIYLILGFFTIVIGYKNYKMFKGSKDAVEKVIYLFAVFCFATPYTIYLLDRYNIPSYFNYTKNVNASDWLVFLGTYFTTLVGSLISAVVLIFVTKSQIERTYKDNISLNKESYRMQNLPYFQYNFEDKIDNVADFNKTKIIMINNGGCDGVEFALSIKNIGLNAVRKTYVILESDLFDKKEITGLSDQSSIDKNEVKKKDFFITNLCKGNYMIKITVYYQDLMKNWYEQRIVLHLDVTDKYIDSRRMCYKKFEVYDDDKIDVIPEFLSDYIENKF